MHSVLRITAGVVACVAMAAGPATAVVGHKKVSTKKYAKVVCGSYGRKTDAIAEFIDTYNNDTSDDAATFQGEVVTLVNEVVADLDTLAAKLAKRQPDIGGGKKIGKLFVKGIESTRDQIADALVDFQAADPNGVAFQADISTFDVAIKLLDVKRTDPFSQVTDQDLLGAFDDEKSCEEVVTIFGG